MNKVDKYLLRNGFNLDGSKMKKKEGSKGNKRNLNIESLLASKEDVIRLKYKRWAIEDRKN